MGLFPDPGRNTSDRTAATVIDFTRRLGKFVIVVKDVPGFLINRILLCYMNEAGHLLEEGMKIEQVDRAAAGFGMRMGPFLLSIYAAGRGYHFLGDLDDTLTATNEFGETATWTFEKESWAWRGGVGLRFRLIPE